MSELPHREMTNAVSPSDPPQVSIIMSMRNSSATVVAAIHSIQLQTLQNWELIVIDDGSTDNSTEIVRSIEDPRIRVITEKTSAGLATRLNQAVALSRGNFIARMDADDICFPERLALQLDYLKCNPVVDVMSCTAVVFADNLELIGTLPIELTHADIVATPFLRFPFPHPTWCGRTEWFRKNPYDPTLTKAEDQDLLLRTFRHSHFSALPNVLVGYRQDTIDLTKRLQGRQATIRSLLNYARRSEAPFPALRGVGVQLFKSAMEIITIALGLDRQMQRRRLKPAPADVARRWLELQRALDARNATRFRQSPHSNRPSEAS